jgi:hypothetical protein
MFIFAMILELFGTLPLLAIHLWLSFSLGTGASIGIGMGGLVTAAVIGTTVLGDKVWMFIPWAWPSRLAKLPGAYLGFTAGMNMPPAEISSGAVLQQLIIGTVAVLICLIACYVGGTIWFNKWEGRKHDEYQVVDSSASVLYGTNTDPIFSSEADLINHLNTTEVYSDKNTYLHVIPLTGEDGKMEGAVALIYEVKITAVGSGGRWALYVIVAALFSPVVYIILFTMVFSKQFIKRINRPLQLLMEAARKIKDKDLDFEINYYSENELGKLCTAFSECRQN